MQRRNTGAAGIGRELRERWRRWFGRLDVDVHRRWRHIEHLDDFLDRVDGRRVG
jgi:hypothetical protein